MSDFELPLVGFTVLSQGAAGIAAVVALRSAASGRGPKLLAAGFLGLGLIASLFHLGRPLMAITALRNLGSAWLSAEILTAGLFFALLLAGIIIKGRIWDFLAAGVGALMVVASGLTYAAPGFPTHDNALPMILFALTALILGLAWGERFLPEDRRRGVAALLGGALLAALAVNLAAACLWTSGGPALRLTAAAFAASPLFWVYMLAALGLPMVLVVRNLRVPAWLPIYLLAGEIVGRMLFFGLPVHSASTLGLLN
jgi:DMSO reductase anchor subunit